MLMTSSCTMTPSQRQAWQDFGTAVAPLAAIGSVAAQGLGAYGAYRQGRALDKARMRLGDLGRRPVYRRPVRRCR